MDLDSTLYFYSVTDSLIWVNPLQIFVVLNKGINIILKLGLGERYTLRYDADIIT